MNKINLESSGKQKSAAWKTRVFLFWVCLLLPMTVSGQEMIRAIYDATTDVTMARTVTPYRKWIVYSENNKMSLFGCMDTSGYSNIFVKTQQHLHVNDMEIVGQTLYFCGSMFNYDIMEDVGVVGFFDIRSFDTPSSMVVNYIFFNEFAELKKLVYYVKESTRHICMIGTGKDQRDYMADAYLFFGDEQPVYYWARSWMYLPNFDAVFDDITSYYDDIVVSARIEDSTEVQICFIQKTPVINSPFFFTVSLETVKIPNVPMNSVLLQTNRYNLYAFYRSGAYLDVCQFNGRNNNTSLRIPVLHTGGLFAEYFKLKDVCVDIYERDEMSALIVKTEGLLTTHRIYHIPQSLFPAGGVVNAHEYSHLMPYIPMTLCGGKNNHTTTMGRYMGNWGMARVVNSIYGQCTGKVESKTREKDHGYDPKDREYRRFNGGAELLSMPVSVLDYTVFQECGDYYMKEDINKQ